MRARTDARIVRQVRVRDSSEHKAVIYITIVRIIYDGCAMSYFYSYKVFSVIVPSVECGVLPPKTRPWGHELQPHRTIFYNASSHILHPPILFHLWMMRVIFYPFYIKLYFIKGGRRGLNQLPIYVPPNQQQQIYGDSSILQFWHKQWPNCHWLHPTSAPVRMYTYVHISC